MIRYDCSPMNVIISINLLVLDVIMSYYYSLSMNVLKLLLLDITVLRVAVHRK